MSHRRAESPKTFLKIVVLGTFLLLFFGGRIAYLYLGNSIEKNLRNNAAVAGVNLDIEDFQTSFPLKFSADSFSLSVPIGRFMRDFSSYGGLGSLAVTGSCSTPNGGLELGAIVLLKKILTAEANCYQGKLVTKFSGPLLSNSSAFEYEAQSISISDYPLAKLYGVKGTLFSTGDGETSEDGSQLKSFKGQLSLKDASYPGGTPIFGPAKLPAIEKLNAECEVQWKDNEFRIDNCSGDSSLGSFKGSANGTVDMNGNILSGLSNFKFNFSDIGQKEIAPYLALAAGKYSENPSKNWGFTWEKPLNRNPFQEIKEL